MLKPQPFILCCKQCGWSQRFAPAGDALVPGVNIKTHCPKCNSSDLEYKVTTNKILDLFRR